nr:hypothetical protein Iba_chr05dCG8480 [Ipomoea batatas]
MYPAQPILTVAALILGTGALDPAFKFPEACWEQLELSGTLPSLEASVEDKSTFAATETTYGDLSGNIPAKYGLLSGALISSSRVKGKSSTKRSSAVVTGLKTSGSSILKNTVTEFTWNVHLAAFVKEKGG